MPKRKIAVFTGNRAEYGLLSPLIKELSLRPPVEVYLIISGAHLLPDFGKTVNEIDASGVKQITEIALSSTQDNKRPDSLLVFSEVVRHGRVVLADMHPDIIVLAGDRYETFAMAVTAFYSNIAIAHLFGGDLSLGGHLDDSVRHSITKLAHLHFTTNGDSYRRVLHLGEEKWRVFNVGYPAIDNVVTGEYSKPDDLAKEFSLDLTRPIIIFTQHPVTTESDLAYHQVKESLQALKELGYQTIITYPCNDPGSELIIEAINKYADNPNFRIKKNLGWRQYLGFLNIAAVVVGNSSSGIMETPMFKVPCVNIGTRQAGRLRSENVIDTTYNKEEIKKAIHQAMYDKEFITRVKHCSKPYRGKRVAKKIAETLESIPMNRKLLQKKMSF